MKIRRGFISNAVIKKSIYAIVICFALHSCSTTIDKNNFNSIAFINDQDDFFDELDKWKVDSAFVQFIGFAPSLESQFWNEKDRRSCGGRITIDGDCYMEEFFEEYDVSKPIYIVYALRRNKYSYSGNTFSQSGINSSDLIDYSSGVGASDAQRLHDQGNYSRTVDTYEYSPFYLGWSDGKATMLSVSEGNEDAIQFFHYVIDEDSPLRQERARATRDVGVFVKGNDQISSVDPSLLHRIQAFVGFTNEKKEIINYYTDSIP